MSKGVTPLFGVNNRSMYTVPVVPSKNSSGFQALRNTTKAAVKASVTPTSVGSKKYPNGKKVKPIT